MPDVKALRAYKKSAIGHKFASDNGTGIPADVKAGRLLSAVLLPTSRPEKEPLAASQSGTRL